MTNKPFRPQRILSYVVASDNGLAPNITGDICTLTVCKSVVRAMAIPNQDWIIGLSTAKHGEHKLIYAMCPIEKIDYKSYWNDPRFACKKPHEKNPYGDNFFFENGKGILEPLGDSRHFGKPEKLARDLKSPVAVIGNAFWYFGSNAPEVPVELRDKNLTVMKPHYHAGRRGHRVTTDKKLVEGFADWLMTSYKTGVHGTPRDLRNFSVV